MWLVANAITRVLQQSPLAHALAGGSSGLRICVAVVRAEGHDGVARLGFRVLAIRRRIDIYDRLKKSQRNRWGWWRLQDAV